MLFRFNKLSFKSINTDNSNTSTDQLCQFYHIRGTGRLFCPHTWWLLSVTFHLTSCHNYNWCLCWHAVWNYYQQLPLELVFPVLLDLNTWTWQNTVNTILISSFMPEMIAMTFGMKWFKWKSWIYIYSCSPWQSTNYRKIVKHSCVKWHSRIGHQSTVLLWLSV